MTSHETLKSLTEAEQTAQLVPCPWFSGVSYDRLQEPPETKKGLLPLYGLFV